MLIPRALASLNTSAERVTFHIDGVPTTFAQQDSAVLLKVANEVEPRSGFGNLDIGLGGFLL